MASAFYLPHLLTGPLLLLMWSVGNSRLYTLLTFYVDTEFMETSTVYMGAGPKELQKATVQSQPQSLFSTYSDRLASSLVEHPSSLPGPKPTKGSHQIHLAQEFPEQIKAVIVCLTGFQTKELKCKAERNK